MAAEAPDDCRRELLFFAKDEEEGGDGRARATHWGSGLSVDLGSTTLRCATWHGSEVRVHPQLALPAYVAFTSAGKVLLGHEAKSAARNAYHVGDLLRLLHAACEEDPEGVAPPPRVSVAVAGAARDFFVAELLGLLLVRARELAEEASGLRPLEALMLSVPAACGQVQRRVLEEAALLADFRWLRLMRSPLGAALWAYAPAAQLAPAAARPAAGGAGGGGSLDGAGCGAGAGFGGERCPSVAAPGDGGEEWQALLLDVGAAHLHCALVVVEGGIFEVRWAGGCACGGADADECLARLCVQRASPFSDVAAFPAAHPAAWRRLLGASEKAKRALTSAPTARVQLPRLLAEEEHPGGLDVDIQISLHDFEEALRQEVLPRLTGFVRRLLKQCGAAESGGGGAACRLAPSLYDGSRRGVDEVVFLGGGARVPAVRRALEQAVLAALKGREPHVRQPPGAAAAASAAALAHAQAYGAALQGAVLGAPRAGSALAGLMLMDTLPRALGVSLEDGSVAWVMPAHTPIPCAKVLPLQLADPSHPAAVIHVVEEAQVEGAPPTRLGATVLAAPADVLRVRLEVDAAGRLHLELENSSKVEPGLAERPPDRAAEQEPRSADRDAQPPLISGEGGAAASRRPTAVQAATPPQAAMQVPPGCGLPCGRATALPGQALACLGARLRLHRGGAGVRWARYGLREPPPPPAGDAVWPAWHVVAAPPIDDEALLLGDEDDEEDEEVEEGGRSPLSDLSHLLGGGKGAGAGGDDRRGRAAERLRRKLCERTMQRGEDARREATGRAANRVETPVEVDPSERPSDVIVCAVCLCTEAELGRCLPFVLEKCGHKCICKPCLRKMKTRQKCVKVECPLCRVASKPVLRDRYNGDVFAAEVDLD